jgi:prepilin-type N-terminal cleavage/methylation domain-containing protein
MKRQGFTIVELLMVIGILAVLLGIITTAATASIRQARTRRANAMKQTLQNGVMAYRQLKDKWPGKLEDWAEQQNKGTVGYLSNGDYDKVMQELLKNSAGKSVKVRVMDPVGLLVMGATGTDGKSGGVDFRSAATKNGPYAKRMSTSEMTVIYLKKESGKAYRYVIEYNAESDSVTVMTQDDYWSRTEALAGEHKSWRGAEVWY